MNEEKKDLQTSFARTIDIKFPPNKLDKASENLQDQFPKVSENNLKPPNNPPNQEQEKQQPEPPNTPTPQPGGMALKPGGDLQKSVDLPIQKKQMDESLNYYKNLNNSLKANHENQKQLGLNNEREKDND